MNDFCVSVLRARQQDGFLPTCPISRDVKTYVPSGEDLSAELVTGGFPCQAWYFCRALHFENRNMFSKRTARPGNLDSGKSRRTRRRPLRAGGGEFSSLRSSTPRAGSQAHRMIFEDNHCMCRQSIVILRKAMLLENVGALLSCKKSTRKVFAYLVKDHSL